MHDARVQREWHMYKIYTTALLPEPKHCKIESAVGRAVFMAHRDVLALVPSEVQRMELIVTSHCSLCHGSS